MSWERTLWFHLGLRYIATIVACGSPLVLEWAHEKPEASSGRVINPVGTSLGSVASA